MDRELRILSGLHRGALLPLGLEGRLSVGSDPSCDIVLVDQGIKPLALTVQLSLQGWQVEHFDAHGRPSDVQELAWGQPIIVGGGVVLTVADSTEEWVFISAEEVARAQTKAPEAGAARPAAADDAPSWLGQNPRPAGTKRKFTQRVVIMGTVMLGFATFSLSRTLSGPDEEVTSSASVLQAERPRRVALDPAMLGPAPDTSLPRLHELDRPLTTQDLIDEAASRPLLGSTPSEAPRTGNRLADIRPSGQADATTPAAHSPEKLRQMMLQRLRDAYLAEKLELELTDSAWTMRGVLDEEESRLLGRILSAFYKEHNVKIPLRAYVNSAEEMLPFKIQQVSGGALASVVTTEGDRLYVGDTHQGYTLQKIDGRRIVFAGKRKVEVVW